MSDRGVVGGFAAVELLGRHAVVTGGASGIGRALVRRFAAEGARAIVVADANLEVAHLVAREVDGLAVGLDAGREADVRALASQATEAHGPVDLFLSNAGVPADQARGLRQQFRAADTLRDGSTVIIRPIAAEDDAQFARAEGFSERSLYLRFLGAPPKPTRANLAYLTEVDHHHHEALVGMTPTARSCSASPLYTRSVYT